MADVFISYTKPERGLTEKLAATLHEAGLTVWWDTELLPKDSFRAEIDTQLDACAAAIIVWSAQSANSYWVLSEADHALRQGKLVNAHHKDIRPEHLPKPFGQIHAVPVTDTKSIITAVERLKAGAGKATHAPSTEASAIAFIKDAIEDALKFAPLLRDAADREVWEGDEAYSKELLGLAEKVYTPLRLLRERLPFAEITSYRGRRLVEQIDESTSVAHRQIAKEVNWLRSYGDRSSVVRGARGDLSYAATHLLDGVLLPDQ